MSILLKSIKFKDYPRRIVLSASRKAKYYKEGDEIPKKYVDESKFYYIDGILCDADFQKPIVKNKNQAGTPKTKVISGQDLHTLQLKDYERSKILKTLKDYYRGVPFSLVPVEFLPVRVEMLYYTDRKDIEDLDNYKAFYEKTMLDFLHEVKILPNDRVDEISRVEHEFFDYEHIRQLVVNIWHDSREERAEHATAFL